MGSTHVQITPWPIGSGDLPTVVTWCGMHDQSPDIRDHYITTDPGNVTCHACIDAMRMAYGQMHEWVPKLRKNDDGVDR